MNPRFLRNLLSVVVLASFWLVASGTSQSFPDTFGESIIEMQVRQDAAYVVEEFAPSARGSSQDRLRFTRVTVDGAPLLLQDMPLPRYVGHWEIASVVTKTVEGGFAFAMASTASEGSFAVVIPQASMAQTTSVDMGGRRLMVYDGNELSVVALHPSRHWVFLKQAATTGEDSFLPLFEIKDNAPKLIANNVIWAGCNEAWCQQVRIENSRLRIYATPVTADSYFSVVTESAPISGNGHYACFDTTGAPAVVFGAAVYSLSMTYPSLVSGSATLSSSSCSAAPVNQTHYDYTEQSWRRSSQTGTFTSGERITVTSQPANGKDMNACDSDCNPVKMRLWVAIDDANSVRLRTFPLHEK